MINGKQEQYLFRYGTGDPKTVSIRKVHRFINGRMFLAAINESKRIVYRRMDTELE